MGVEGDEELLMKHVPPDLGVCLRAVGSVAGICGCGQWGLWLREGKGLAGKGGCSKGRVVGGSSDTSFTLTVRCLIES